MNWKKFLAVVFATCSAAFGCDINSEELPHIIQSDLKGPQLASPGNPPPNPNGPKLEGQNSSGIVPEPAPPAPTKTVDGVWRVGEDMRPGTYRSDGLKDHDRPCEWTIVRRSGGDSTGTLEAGGIGPVLVKLTTFDLGFSSAGCKPWVLVTAP